MVNEIVDKKEKTIVVETDYDFKNLKITKHREHFHFSFIKDEYRSMGFCLFFNKFKGRKYYPKEIFIDNINIETKTVHLSYN